MRKIKTREKEKDIKALDKSAVIGQRMKTAFLRSKRNAESLMDKDDPYRIRRGSGGVCCRRFRP